MTWVSATILALYLGWFPTSYFGRAWAVPGSRLRYVWNTVERITRWLATINPLAGLLGLLDHPNGREVAQALTVTALAVGMYIWAWHAQRKLDRDDDDDWFKKMRRRFTAWSARRAVRPVIA